MMHAGPGTSLRIRSAGAVVGLAGLVLALLGAVGPTAAAAPARTSSAPTHAAAVERAVVAHLDRIRAARGLGRVRILPCVDAGAERRAAALGRAEGGTGVVTAAGPRACRRTVEVRTTVPARVRAGVLVRRWLRSPQARAALLHRGLRGVGVAVAPDRGSGAQVLLLAVGGRAVRGGRPVPVEEAAPTPAPSLGPLEVAILDEANRHRVAHGLRALRPSRCAITFAHRHAARLADADRLFHADLGRLINRCAASGAAENLATGTGVAPVARDVVRQWMASASHRANILDRSLTGVGVAVAADPGTGRWYATLDFLRVP